MHNTKFNVLRLIQKSSVHVYTYIPNESKYTQLNVDFKEKQYLIF